MLFFMLPLAIHSTVETLVVQGSLPSSHTNTPYTDMVYLAANHIIVTNIFCKMEPRKLNLRQPACGDKKRQQQLSCCV